ncbi:hemolysin XhlA family protein [Bacillus sp. ISL-57]|nr:hemolysin XhlA family protein [Bacillus sp. ISL-57]
MDIWKQTIQKDIEELKKDNKESKEKIVELKRVTDFHERDIKDIKDTLKEINEDTKWLKRTITNAIVTATISAVIGGVIAIVFTVWKG